MKKILLVLAVTSMIISCSSTDNKEVKNLTNSEIRVVHNKLLGTTWKLEKYTIDGKLVDVVEDSKADLIFDEEKLFGNGSVNRYFGSYTLEKNDLTIGKIATTMMMGPENAAKQEFIYTHLLEQVTSYEIINDELRLLEGKEVVLVFKSTL